MIEIRHQAKYLSAAFVVVVTVLAPTSRPAHAMNFGSCYSMVLEHGFRKHWLDVGPGILIRAGYETCRHLLERA